MKILLDKILFESSPIRTQQDETKLGLLVASLRRYGQLVPVRVRPDKPGHFRLVYGYRRVEAAYRLGWKEIEATVDTMDDLRALEMAIIENMVREKMNPLDVARALKRLQETSGWSIREMARRGIMTRSQIMRALALLDDPEPIQKLVRSGDLIKSHAQTIRKLALTENEKVAVAEKSAKDGLVSSEIDVLGRRMETAESNEAKTEILDEMVTVSPADAFVGAGTRWLDVVVATTIVARNGGLETGNPEIFSSWLYRISEAMIDLQKEIVK